MCNDKNVFMLMYILIAFASFDLVATADEFKGTLFEGSENISLIIEQYIIHECYCHLSLKVTNPHFYEYRI